MRFPGLPYHFGHCSNRTLFTLSVNCYHFIIHTRNQDNPVHPEALLLHPCHPLIHCSELLYTCNHSVSVSSLLYKQFRSHRFQQVRSELRMVLHGRMYYMYWTHHKQTLRQTIKLCCRHQIQVRSRSGFHLLQSI